IPCTGGVHITCMTDALALTLLSSPGTLLAAAVCGKIAALVCCI
ncbi:hypothetical protein A2U01_0103963, partial [Trifolium medium]|nr:hypothetical protein [Trifolium medium]